VPESWRAVPNDAGLLGNASLISQGVFDPVMFGAAQGNLGFSSTQISQVIVPQWIGQSKAYYILPRKFEGKHSRRHFAGGNCCSK
jgi:hypothetical protein